MPAPGNRHDRATTATSGHAHYAPGVILLSDPRVLAVPVRECGEPLAEVTGVPGLALDPRERDGDGAFGRVREGVLTRLAAAAAALPDGLRFLVIEGYRTMAEQSRRFAAYQDHLRETGITDPAELHRQASMFVSPSEVAPHCAGAAVDLTLVDGEGTELDMGVAVNGYTGAGGKLCPFAAAGVPAAARRNRDLLAAALTGAGFVNYPTEWWHWSFGDRYWALLTGADAARYGPL